MQIRKQNRVKPTPTLVDVQGFYSHLLPVQTLVFVLAGASLTGATRLLVDLSKAG